ncbi:MAG: S1 RNA-binding domain-containing protein, partial [Myxococcota bacterium]
MTQDATTAEDTHADPQDALYNSFHQGTYIETLDDGYVFSFGDGLRALVDRAEYKDGAHITEGLETTLLIERPHGAYWLASSRKADKLAYYERLEEMAADGAEIEGIITGVNRGGLSVDAGVCAFVPKSQVDEHRVDDFTPYLGRKSRFKVLEFKREDATLVLSRRKIVERENKKVRKDVLAKLEKGEVFEGVVRTVKPYGVFVDVGGGVEGLLHVTNIAWGRIDHPNELFRPGDDVRVVVLDYNRKKKRLELGRKQLLQDPWASLSEDYTEGAVVRGKVVSLADFGAFVELAPGLEGLVHVTELSWTRRIHHPSDVLELGQDVGVKIIGVDTEERRMSLSIKLLETNPWEVLAEQMPPGTVFT